MMQPDITPEQRANRKKRAEDEIPFEIDFIPEATEHVEAG